MKDCYNSFIAHGLCSAGRLAGSRGVAVFTWLVRGAPGSVAWASVPMVLGPLSVCTSCEAAEPDSFCASLGLPKL